MYVKLGLRPKSTEPMLICSGYTWVALVILGWVVHSLTNKLGCLRGVIVIPQFCLHNKCFITVGTKVGKNNTTDVSISQRSNHIKKLSRLTAVGNSVFFKFSKYENDLTVPHIFVFQWTTLFWCNRFLIAVGNSQQNLGHIHQLSSWVHANNTHKKCTNRISSHSDSRQSTPQSKY